MSSPDHTSLKRRLGRRYTATIADLIERRIEEEPDLRQWYEAMSDKHSRVHEGEAHAVESEHFRRGLRYFHAWRVRQVRRCLADKLDAAEFLDVGDTDGLMLKHLGKKGLGFNISQIAVDNIRSNDVEAQIGDGHGLPFPDGSFDAVLCFETLEHVENQAQVLDELARVCRPDGRVFISIPWVAHTVFHARDPGQQRGHQHITELARDDFAALLSHTNLELVSEAVCEMLGRPRSLAERVVTLEARRGNLVGGMFRRFQFFELQPRTA